MAVTVYVPTPYRVGDGPGGPPAPNDSTPSAVISVGGLTAGEARVSVAGQSLAEAIEGLEASYPGFRARIFEDGELKHYVIVYVNGEEARSLEGLHTPLNDGDEVSIIPALAGGGVLGSIAG